MKNLNLAFLALALCISVAYPGLLVRMLINLSNSFSSLHVPPPRLAGFSFVVGREDGFNLRICPTKVDADTLMVEATPEELWIVEEFINFD